MIRHKDLTEEINLWTNLYNILIQLSRKENVKFALMCAEESNSITYEEKLCIELVKKWLNNSKSVTEDDLRQTADRVYLAYTAVAHAAWAAFWFDAAAATANTAYMASLNDKT